VTFSPTNALSLLTTGATSVTFPTSGTLYGTATGSITSLQLATSLTDETGTGAAVFGTSPTISGLALSGLTTGSVLFSGTSNLVTQDDANFFFDDTTNELGIGTNAPLAKLEVVGASTAGDGSDQQGLMQLSTGTGINANNKLLFGIHDGDYAWIQAYHPTVLARNLVLNSFGGNVGVGTTNPGSVLDVRGADVTLDGLQSIASIFSSTTAAVDKGGTLLLGGQTGNVTANYGFAQLKGAKESAIAGDYSGYLAFYTVPAASGMTEKMRITSTGNVGIGMTNPGTKLQVAGDIYASGYVQAGLAVMQTSGGYATFGSNADANAVRINTNAYGAGSDGITVVQGGNVGIGTTAPTAKLDVAGTLRSTGNTTPTSGVGLELLYLEPTAYIYSYDRNTPGYKNLALGAANQMYLKNDGNVGIGTTAPAEKLNISAGNIRLSNSLGGTGEFGRIVGWNDIGTQSEAASIAFLRDQVTDGNYGAIAFNTLAGSERMRITSAGNVGIGTTAPSYMLDLKEQASVSATISFQDTDTLRLGIIGSARAANDLLTGSVNTDLVINGPYAGTSILFGTANSERMRISSNGNVGIGTVNPEAKLQIGTDNSAEVIGSVPVARILGNGNSQTSQTLLRLNRPQVDGAYYSGSVDFNVYSFDPSGAPNYGPGTQLDIALKGVSGTTETGNVNVMTLRDDGTVGIGTTNPGTKLDIQATDGSSRVRVLDGSTLRFQAGDDAGNGGFMQITNEAGTVTTYIRGDTGNSYINAGNLGIGLTNPSHKLDVSGNVNATGVIAATLWSSADIRKLSVSQTLTFRSSAGTPEMTLDGSGNLGIGTISPRSLLDVTSGTANIAGDTSNAANFTAANITGSSANLSVNTNDAQGVDIGGSISLGGLYRAAARDNASFAVIKAGKTNSTDSNYSGYLSFGTRNSGSVIAERMRIDNLGNVGIGNTNPSYNLEVGLTNGTINVRGASGQLYVNNIGPNTGATVSFGSSLLTGGTYNGQTISSAANFTGTIAVASLATFGNGRFAANGTGFYFGEQSTAYRDPATNIPQVVIRSDEANAGLDETKAALVLYNANGGLNTGAGLAFVSREAVGAGNDVALSGIFGIKETAGTAGSWSTGGLRFWTKNQGDIIEALSISGAGAVTTVGTINGQTISSAANFTGTLTAATTINSTSGPYQIGGITRLTVTSSTYTTLHDGAGRIGIYLGSTDPGNYYDNTTHYFRSIAQANFARINSSGVTVDMGSFNGSGAGLTILPVSILTTANGSWGGQLAVGGNGGGSGVATIAKVQATDGNLHMDPGLGKVTYINYYSGAGVNFGDGASGVVATVSSAGLISGSSFSGAGTGLTGTAASLTAGLASNLTGSPNITTGTITSGLINGQTISSTANFTGTMAVTTSVTSPSFTVTSNGQFMAGSVAQNMKLKSGGAGSVGITGYDSADTWMWQLYGAGSTYGFLNGNWAGWDMMKTVGGALVLNGSQTVITSASIGSQSVSYATTAGSAPANGGTATSAYYQLSQDRNRATMPAPNSRAQQTQFDFANGNIFGGTYGNYGGVMTWAPYDGTTASTGDASYQIGVVGTAANGGGYARMVIRKGIDTTWNAWQEILTSSNYNSYSPTLTGTGASGTWAITAANITSQANSATITAATAATINTIALRDASGDITVRLIRGEYPVDTGTTGNYFVTANAGGSGTDNYQRLMSIATVRTALGNYGGWITDDTSVPKNHLANSGALGFTWSDAEVSDTLTASSVPCSGVSGNGVGCSDVYVNTGGDTMSGNLYFNNYGLGIIGTYSSTNYQGIFAMGDAYKLPAGGGTPGTLYGLAWTHSNVGGESKAGLGHQMLVMENGVTQTAIGNGIWTRAAITAVGAISASNFSGSSSGTNTGDQTNISGNAATATYATSAGSVANSITGGWNNASDSEYPVVWNSGNAIYSNTTVLENPAQGLIRLAKSAYDGQLIFGTAASTWNAGIRQFDSAAAEMRIWEENNNGKIFITVGSDQSVLSPARPTTGLMVGSNGYVGIGDYSTTMPAYKFTVKGTPGDWTAAINQDSASVYGLLGYGSTYAIYGSGPIYGTTTITAGGAISASNFSGSSSGTNTGDQTTISGNAGTATTLIGSQSDWASYRSSAVANMLGWKNYGNAHVIFDASASTSPTGSAVNNTNSAIAWTATYPTLMGWNGTSTYGVRVDSARIADSITSQANSATITAATAATGNTIALRDASGHLTVNYGFGSYFNSSDDVSTGTVTYLMGKFGDNYYRSATAAKVATFLSGSTMNISGTSTGLSGTPNISVGTIQTSGNVTVGASGGGKITVTTWDPPYTINGVGYATYGTAMIGVKEEVTGVANVSQVVDKVGYKQIIDFKTLEEGSDLWLFSRAVDVSKNINKMSVLLTPMGNARVWYHIDKDNFTLTIYSTKQTEVSYRLTAPRFDTDSWTNYNNDEGVVGLQPPAPIFPELVIGDPTAIDTLYQGFDFDIDLLFEKLVAWFADSANGIGELFAKKATLEEVCLKDTNGTSCYNRSQLDTLLASASSSTTTTPITTTTTTTTPSTGSGPSADTIPPVITLTGETIINLNVGDVYTESGATALDDVDGSVAVVITGNVDTAVVGTYTVQYNAVDTAGNSAVEVTRTINVVALVP
jgi:hypothetical protein